MRKVATNICLYGGLAICLMLLSFKYAYSTPVTVKTAAELETAVSQASPGDVIEIASGNYTGWSCKLNAHGNADKPIVICAAQNGQVRFSGIVNTTIFTITGSYLKLSGLLFEHCQVTKVNGKFATLVELLNTKNCALSNCIFEKIEVMTQFTPIVVISGNGEDNRVDHCKFIANVNNQEVQVKITEENVPLHTMIDHNEFRDKAKVTWPVFNGGECIQIGQNPVMLGTRKAFSMVRDNSFINCDGEPEVMSNKSSNNTYVHNYLENCHGELVMRGGHDCTIDSNVIKGGSAGIRLNGSHHTVTHNTISDVQTGIRLMYGMSIGKNITGFYVAATDCIITGNKINNVKTGILIGDAKNTDWTGKFDTTKYPSRTMQDVAPQNNEIKNNTITNAEIALKQVD